MSLTIQTVLDAIGRPADFVVTIADARLERFEGKGFGLVTTRARPQGELLCRLDGQVIDCERYPELMEALEWNALSERLLLVRAVRTSYGYINHSRSPNVAIDPDGICMRTLCPLAAGAELLIDYLAPPVPPAYLASAEGRLLASSG
ncbi:MAG TPA: SET domain-containing protein [Polyangiales bacterium]